MNLSTPILKQRAIWYAGNVMSHHTSHAQESHTILMIH